MNKPLYLVRLTQIILVFSIVTFTFTGTGCRLLRRDKQSIAEKKQKETDKKSTAEYEKARKQHYEHQSKEAKKMMKRTQKKADKLNKPKKRKTFFNGICK